MTANLEALISYPKAQPVKIEGFLEKISHGNRRTKPQFINEALSYIFSHPSIATDTVSILGEKHDKNSSELLGWLQDPEKIKEFVSTQGKTAKKSDFKEIFDFLDTPGSEIAQAMLIGYLSQPTKELERSKKDTLKQQRATVKSNKIGLNLAEALMECEIEDTKRNVVTIINDYFARPELEQNTFLDMLMANSAFAHPKKVAAEADEIFRYFDILSKQYLGFGINEKYHQFINGHSHPVRLAPGMVLRLITPNKEPPLKETWDGTEEQVHSFEQNRRSLLKQLQERASDILSNQPLILSTDEPQATKLGVEVAKSYFQQIIDIIEAAQTEIDFQIDWKIIRSSQGRLIFIIGPSTEVQIIREDLWLKVREIVFKHNQTIDEEASFLPINQDELNTSLEYLKPIGIDSEKVAEAVPKLIEEAQGGLNAISKRGIKSKLTLKTEGFLQDMGLNEIFFQQEEQGIRVITSWNGGKYSFLIDRDYQPKGLENLTDDNRNWLLMIVFSYLKAIKNRGEDKISFIGELSGFDETVDEDEELSKGTGKQVSRMPFLRVLALGDHSHELSVDRYEELTRFHFGVSLSELNSMFLQIQSNRNLLTDPNSDLNQNLNALPHGQIIKKQLEKIINRTMNKTSKPYWKEVRLNGETFYKLVPKNPPPNYDENSYVYMVTFVDETLLPGAQPREVKCPGAALSILQMSLDEEVLAAQ